VIKPVIINQAEWGFGPMKRLDDVPDPDDLLPIFDGDYQYVDFEKPTNPPLSYVVTLDDTDPKFPVRRRTPDRRIEHLGYDAKGSLVLGAVEDLDHAAYTVYDPPLPLIPADMQPNSPMKFTCNMIVTDLKKPSVEKDRGSCVVTITADTLQPVTSPAGRYKCVRITSDYTAKLKLANIVTHTESWYAEDIGLIAEKSDETIKALFLSFGNHHTLLLRERLELPADAHKLPSPTASP
jgi:hypothetical protein